MINVSSVKSILVSLIESIDMYNYLLRDHHRHTAVIAYQLGNQYGLDSKALGRLVLAASIHDIGALYVKEKEELLYADAVNPGPHEELGALMLSGVKPFTELCRIIRHHHVKYYDVVKGIVPESDVPNECYFLHLADRIDVLLTTWEGEGNSKEYIIGQIKKRFGSVFLPDLEASFTELAHKDEFWENIISSSFNDLLFMSVESEACAVDNNDMDSIASVFARIVDFKSKWTSCHSKSVSVLAENIGKLYGMDGETCHDLRIAGYLHDIGKIAIPSEMLDKPAALDEDEFRVMKSHATYSSLILSKISFLGKISKWASSHHEKRDQSGYPLHISENDFSIEMDILAYADIFSALAEDRPYRSAMPINRILSILGEFAGSKLDSSVFEIIKENINDLYQINIQAVEGFRLTYA